MSFKRKCIAGAFLIAVAGFAWHEHHRDRGQTAPPIVPQQPDSRFSKAEVESILRNQVYIDLHSRLRKSKSFWQAALIVPNDLTKNPVQRARIQIHVDALDQILKDLENIYDFNQLNLTALQNIKARVWQSEFQNIDYNKEEELIRVFGREESYRAAEAVGRLEKRIAQLEAEDHITEHSDNARLQGPDAHYAMLDVAKNVRRQLLSKIKTGEDLAETIAEAHAVFNEAIEEYEQALSESSDKDAPSLKFRVTY